MKIRLALAGLVVFTAFARNVTASVATFENFPETTSITVPFVDPASSITFSNPQNSAGYFGIDFGSATANISDLPGHFLTGNGVSPGNAFGLGENFGFDARLPSPASGIQLDLIYLNVGTSAGTVTLTSFDSTGKQVGTSVITPTRTTSSGYLQTKLLLPTGSSPISTFTVRTSNLASGFDNVSVTAVAAPEPAALGLVSLLTVGLLRRHRAA